MKLVILESPFAGDVEGNIEYAKKCIRDCLERGESPITSHLLFTQEGVLDDDIFKERVAGICAGHAWYKVCDLCVAYMDKGLSSEMSLGTKIARQYSVPIEYRNLPEIGYDEE